MKLEWKRDMPETATWKVTYALKQPEGDSRQGN